MVLGRAAHNDGIEAKPIVVCAPLLEKRRGFGGVDFQETNLAVEIAEVPMGDAEAFSLADDRLGSPEHPRADSLPPDILADAHAPKDEHIVFEAQAEDAAGLPILFSDDQGIQGPHGCRVALCAVESEDARGLLRVCPADADHASESCR
jgi:hypothetical protein